MKLARFEREHGGIGWRVIVKDEAFDFRLVERGSKDVLSNAETAGGYLVLRQRLQLHNLLQMIGTDSLNGIVDRLSCLKADEFADYRTQLPGGPYLPPIEATSFRD